MNLYTEQSVIEQFTHQPGDACSALEMFRFSMSLGKNFQKVRTIKIVNTPTGGTMTKFVKGISSKVNPEEGRTELTLHHRI